MIVTAYKLDYRRPEIASAISNQQHMHKLLCNAFGKSRQDAGLLYRIDESSMILFLKSNEIPPVIKGFEEIAQRKITLDEIGLDNFRFSIVCSPNYKWDKKRCYIRDERLRKEWLYKKLHGCSIEKLSESQVKRNVFISHSDNKGKDATIILRQYDGVLKITDPKMFYDTMNKGVGPHLAYGAGLLMLM